MEKVTLQSNVTGNVVINLPYLHRKLDFMKKGAIKKIEKELFDEILYDPGVDYMLKNGIISVLEEEAKEEAEIPEDLIELNDKLLKRMFGPMPISEYKTTLKALKRPQLEEVKQYILKNHDTVNGERLEIFKEISNINIDAAIRVARQNAAPIEGK